MAASLDKAILGYSMLNPGKHTFLLFSIVLWVHAGIAQEPSDRWKTEYGFSVAFLKSPTQIGQGTNATGGEKLLAKLGGSLALGSYLEIHNDLFGLQANFLSLLSKVEVENEFGTDFPNHGDSPWLLGADFIVYPFANALGNTRLIPFVAGGVGGMLISVDLDNIHDQELYFSWIWDVGAGMKLRFDEDGDGSLRLQIKTHHLWRQGPIDGFNSLSLTLSIDLAF